MFFSLKIACKPLLNNQYYICFCFLNIFVSTCHHVQLAILMRAHPEPDHLPDIAWNGSAVAANGANISIAEKRTVVSLIVALLQA